jgi:hypothetical protein
MREGRALAGPAFANPHPAALPAAEHYRREPSMSDKQLRVQHDEVVARNREQRLATQRQAQRLANERAAARGRTR